MSDKEAEPHISSWQKHKVLYLWVIAYLVVMVVVACIAVIGSLNAPRDLGPDLVYIGRQDFGYFILSDSPPSSEYFFATNMSIESLKNLILKLGYVYDDKNSSEFDNNANLSFFGPTNDTGLYINYYSDLKSAQSSTSAVLKKTDKQHEISLMDDVYGRLRKSLQSANLLDK